MNQEPKMILIWRADLRNSKGQKVRTGKVAAQLAHAAMAAVLENATDHSPNREAIVIPLTDETGTKWPLSHWLNGKFTKVCVAVNSEKELLDLYCTAVEQGINAALIKDAGLTEFDGVATYTAVAIGPDYPAILDPLTRHLPLL